MAADFQKALEGAQEAMTLHTKEAIDQATNDLTDLIQSNKLES